LGHFVLTMNLINLLQKTKESRVINLSSRYHKMIRSKDISWEEISNSPP